MKAESLNWLIGKWIRLNDEEGYTTYEEWYKKSEFKYSGYTYTTQDDNLVWEEKTSFSILTGSSQDHQY